MFFLIQMGYCFQLLIPMQLYISKPHFLFLLVGVFALLCAPGARERFCHYLQVALQFSLNILKTKHKNPSTLLLHPTPQT